ncbi:MAG: hypothetical protein J2P28_12055 [Actinobacteria bacterium]|nr:hypothetical protein [Actinomycetota bacterium]
MAQNFLVTLVIMFCVLYQSNPDFARWTDYQLLRAAGWLGYWLRWGQWRWRRHQRAVDREQREDYLVVEHHPSDEAFLDSLRQRTKPQED